MKEIQDQIQGILDKLDRMNERMDMMNAMATDLLEALTERNKEEGKDVELKPKYTKNKGISFYLSKKKQ